MFAAEWCACLTHMTSMGIVNTHTHTQWWIPSIWLNNSNVCIINHHTLTDSPRQIQRIKFTENLYHCNLFNTGNQILNAVIIQISYLSCWIQSSENLRLYFSKEGFPVSSELHILHFERSLKAKSKVPLNNSRTNLQLFEHRRRCLVHYLTSITTVVKEWWVTVTRLMAD